MVTNPPATVTSGYWAYVELWKLDNGSYLCGGMNYGGGATSPYAFESFDLLTGDVTLSITGTPVGSYSAEVAVYAK
jgi:hypothetical protein